MYLVNTILGGRYAHETTKTLSDQPSGIYALMILSMLLSAVGINPVSAAPAGTALQFNGNATDKQHVTFGAAPE